MWALDIRLQHQATSKLRHGEDFLEFRSSRQLQVNSDRRHEARQHIGIAQCLPGPEVMRLFASATTQQPGPTILQDVGRNPTTSKCPSLFDDSLNARQLA